LFVLIFSLQIANAGKPTKTKQKSKQQQQQQKASAPQLCSPSLAFFPLCGRKTCDKSRVDCQPLSIKTLTLRIGRHGWKRETRSK